MPKSTKLRVMISSRCDDKFPAGPTEWPLTEIREQLKHEIEALQVFGKQLFEVWINEDAPPQGGNLDSWSVCLRAAQECDIFICLFTGYAGWANNGGSIGICHAELMAVLSTTPGKVRIIEIDEEKIAIKMEKSLEKKRSAAERNQSFKKFVKVQNLFRGGIVATVDDLKQRVKEALYDALLGLAQAGVREVSKGRFHSGQALDWSRLDFQGRRKEMTRVLREAMLKRTAAQEDGEHLIVTLADNQLLVVPDAIPAAFSVAPARDMVGQPFLYDYKFSRVLNKFKGKRGGPVHIIACHKTATEAQAMKLLGFPDATVVSAPFGIFVADDIQKVQFAFIVNCRDESTTRHGVQRFFEWLSQTGEDARVATRAQARARIVSAIAEEAAR